MKILDFFRTPRKRSAAQVAKERLQIIVSHETSHDDESFINDLQRELLQVISKYVNIDPEQIKVQLEKHGGQSVLELNVTLPDLIKAAPVQSTQPEAEASSAKDSEQTQTGETKANEAKKAEDKAELAHAETKVKEKATAES